MSDFGSAEEDVPGGGQAGDARAELGHSNQGRIDHLGTSFRIARRRGLLAVPSYAGPAGSVKLINEIWSPANGMDQKRAVKNEYRT